MEYIYPKVAICSLWTVCPCFIYYIGLPKAPVEENKKIMLN